MMCRAWRGGNGGVASGRAGLRRVRSAGVVATPAACFPTCWSRSGPVVVVELRPAANRIRAERQAIRDFTAYVESRAGQGRASGRDKRSAAPELPVLVGQPARPARCTAAAAALY
jgi:hypothetical protein